MPAAMAPGTAVRPSPAIAAVPADSRMALRISCLMPMPPRDGDLSVRPGGIAARPPSDGIRRPGIRLTGEVKPGSVRNILGLVPNGPRRRAAPRRRPQPAAARFCRLDVVRDGDRGPGAGLVE